MSLHLTEENFNKEVMESELPVLVDFWASWCTPCKLISPIIEEVSAEYQGRIKVAKLSVEEAPSIASRYGIMSIPAILLFKGGKIMGKTVGALSKDELKKFINSNI